MRQRPLRMISQGHANIGREDEAREAHEEIQWQRRAVSACRAGRWAQAGLQRADDSMAGLQQGSAARGMLEGGVVVWLREHLWQRVAREDEARRAGSRHAAQHPHGQLLQRALTKVGGRISRSAQGGGLTRPTGRRAGTAARPRAVGLSRAALTASR